jgi:hypothetical protein
MFAVAEGAPSNFPRLRCYASVLPAQRLMAQDFRTADGSPQGVPMLFVLFLGRRLLLYPSKTAIKS